MQTPNIHVKMDKEEDIAFASNCLFDCVFDFYLV